jgi:hypothetical protein
MIDYFKYLIKHPLKLLYCITVLVFFIIAFIIVMTQIYDGVGRLFIGFLLILIFIVAQFQPIIEYTDKEE